MPNTTRKPTRRTRKPQPHVATPVVEHSGLLLGPYMAHGTTIAWLVSIRKKGCLIRNRLANGTVHYALLADVMWISKPVMVR